MLGVNLGPTDTQSPSPGSQHYRGWITGMAVATGFAAIIAIILAWILLRRRYRIVKVESERSKDLQRSESFRSGQLSQRGNSAARPPVELPVRETTGAEMPERGDFGAELPIRSAEKTELPLFQTLQEREKPTDGGWI
ncbi:MAG: hypothetical protein M1840_006951 [Geoglossum simile]|nr:MAG: hypothetical protein M1840_006951 [Geoglossum simile]